MDGMFVDLRVTEEEVKGTEQKSSPIADVSEHDHYPICDEEDAGMTETLHFTKSSSQLDKTKVSWCSSMGICQNLFY